jgi:hypothetical protein
MVLLNVQFLKAMAYYNGDLVNSAFIFGNANQLEKAMTFIGTIHNDLAVGFIRSQPKFFDFNFF